MISRRVWLVGATLLMLASVPAGPPHAVAATVGEKFGGYDATASGAGFTGSPNVPAVLPVESPVEGTLSLAVATLATGGFGFGRASSFWPGTPLVGVRPLVEVAGGPRLPIPDYPVVAESREYEDPETNPTPGMNMKTDAKPERVWAYADNAGFTIPGVVDVGAVRSTSTVVLEAGKITATNESQLDGIDFVAGAVHIDSIKSVAVTETDGTTSTCGGSTTVNGATVGGAPVVIDDEGVHAQGEPILPGVDPNEAIAQALGASGFTIRTLKGIDGCGGPAGSRSTPGVLVSAPLPAAGAIPPGGHFDIILASAASAASATPPFDLSPGPQAPALAPTFADVVGRTPGPATGSALPAPVVVASPEVPVGRTLLPRTPLGYNVAGVPAPFVIGTMLAAIPGARRIRRYMRRVMDVRVTGIEA